MEHLYKLKKMANKELQMLGSQERLTGGNIELAYKLTDIIKNIDKIEMLEDGGHSEDGGYMARGGYREGGSSYAYNGEPGRYSERRDRYGRYSRDEGKEHMLREIGGMMDDLTGSERETISRAMEIIRRS